MVKGLRGVVALSGVTSAEVRSSLPGEALRLLFTPLLDPGVVAALKNIRHLMAPVLGRPSLGGMTQAPVVVERIRGGRIVISQRAGEESDDGIGYGQSRDLAPRQDEVAQ